MDGAKIMSLLTITSFITKVLPYSHQYKQVKTGVWANSLINR